jgi:hypothetical protein
MSRNGHRMRRFEAVLDLLPKGHVCDGELRLAVSQHLIGKVVRRGRFPLSSGGFGFLAIPRELADELFAEGRPASGF